MQVIEIRVGLCGCTNIYNGQLNGKRFFIDKQWYLIREVLLPDEKFHTQSLKRTRCHFFIDAATGDDGQYMWIDQMDLQRSLSGSSERSIAITFAITTEGRLLSRKSVLSEIREWIAGMVLGPRTAWLERISPHKLVRLFFIPVVYSLESLITSFVTIVTKLVI
jgi:hypothetical protein